jgi:hypothetical protein
MFQKPVDGGFSASVASLASDMMSFTSPTFSGLRRSGGVVFPRAKRDTGRPPADVGDIAQVKSHSSIVLALG